MGRYYRPLGVVLGEVVKQGHARSFPSSYQPVPAPLQLEFAVQMTCQSCVDAVRTSLQGIAGKNQMNFCESKPETSGRGWQIS